MNCKQGDLAVVVRSGAGNEGRIVEVIKFLGKPPEGWMNRNNDYWMCRVSRPMLNSKKVPCMEGPISDSCLRPIRDQPGEDETLTWAPVPTTIKEHA